MVERIPKEQLGFSTMNDVQKYYDDRSVEYLTVPVSEMSLDSVSNLSIAGDSFPLSRTGMDSLLKQAMIPENYAYDVCDQELLAYSLNRIFSKRGDVMTAKLVNGKVSFISSDLNKMIDDKLLVDSVSDVIKELHQVEKSEGFLRITFLKDFEENIAAGDVVRGGYEILNHENKQNGLSVSLFFVRMVCSNGMVKSDPVEQFRFSSTQPNAVADVLMNLRKRISMYQDIMDYISALRFTVDKPVDVHLKNLKKYLNSFSGKDFFEANFSEISAETPWYEVLNGITNSAKQHQIERRREFELMAGSLLESFFHRDNYGRYIFRKRICTSCPVLN